MADEMQKELGFYLAHIGINTGNEDSAREAAKLFEIMFGFVPKEGNGSIFCDSCIELMKKPFLGKNGHIAIATNDILKAVEYFESKGFGFNYDTAAKDSNGKFPSIYFEDEIAGFAVHLLNRPA